MVGVIMECQKSKILFRGLIEIYISCNNLFLYYREQKNNLKRLYLCYLVVLLGEVTYIEPPIVEPCVSKNQKEIFGMWVCLGKKS